jgi:hypothetical protein
MRYLLAFVLLAGCGETALPVAADSSTVDAADAGPCGHAAERCCAPSEYRSPCVAGYSCDDKGHCE